MSSSSSLCNFDDLYNYPFRNQEPWYDYFQTMKNPLIYYAQVEHQPPLHDRENLGHNPDFAGFANWLDDKYGEYIQEEQRRQINRLAVPEPRKPKKLLATMKSHFTKRHKTKDGARQKRSCNSCEYIMKPNGMSLTGSDCNRSNIKAVCSETHEKKSFIQSVSMNSVRYDVDYQKSIEIIVTEGDTNDKPEDICSCDKTEVLTIYKSQPNNLNVASIGPLPCDPPKMDRKCECKPSAKVNVCTQYDKNLSVPKSPAPSSAAPVLTKNKAEKHAQSKGDQNLRKTPKTSDISCMCSLERVLSSQPTKSTKIAQECQCTASLPNVVKGFGQKNAATTAKGVCAFATTQQATSTLRTPTVTPIVPVIPVTPPPNPVATSAIPIASSCSPVNETVQTSDTSIRLDDEAMKYPFFMKIVRADKLITDC